MSSDEMWGVNDDGKVWTSCINNGVMEYSEKEGQYVSHCHFRETKLGNLVRAEIEVDDKLLPFLPQA